MLRIFKTCFVAALLCFVGVANASKIDLETIAEWWNIPYPESFDTSQLKTQGFIHVKGNQFVDASGKHFVFRGMNIASPDKLLKQGQWKKSLFAELKDWGVNTIRLPVHPIGWRSSGKYNYIELIDEAVVWANELGIYLILDWHSIGYLPNGLFQHPMYKTNVQETMEFWQFVAARYKGVPTIAVYEIFNEPTDMGGKAGTADWLEWKAFNEQVIDVIYAHDKQVIPLVAGFNWAYDLTSVIEHPIEREGIAYVSHPYPQKAKPKPRTKDAVYASWTEKWGHVSAKYPIIATELGWVEEGGFGAHIPVIDDGSYGPWIIEYMEARNISWTAWCFDPEWSPTMIHDWDFKPTEQGKFFKKVLQAY
ncbi:glycoside hydrolase family 5 protein [Agaribacter marinus]|uniref:Glycoside hydrolase family 5 domain-containing protein n=1 Tax=Agaribacter marinus TaxID=1431249 RepID=A0AA37T046_9ALTE|nr:glycoside hydrolase family 5 protein [Agaribacter marinus]GLR71804.1 hypothetical protein GCM10007852_27120 [Agaribacter marinus]